MDEDKIVQMANDKATNGDRYSYDRVLGRGHFGQVLKARGRGKNAVVAVKIIEAKKSITDFLLFKTPASAERGRKEVNLLTDLGHDNIIAIRDHFEFPIDLWTTGLGIVMEYCPGGDLEEHLKNLVTSGMYLTEKERFRWYKQLASAVQYIHQNCVAHRDLKPANILVDAENNLKVADVGIAKELCGKIIAGVSFKEYMQTMAGTPMYVAPEVFREHYTISCDIFSMGLVMFVICELPKFLRPLCQGKYCLGAYMCSNKEAQKEKATSLLDAKSCPPDEMKLFDDMLQHDYKKRPKAAILVERLNEIEERRKEEERMEEEEERRRMEEEEERRRMKEQGGVWSWVKSWFNNPMCMCVCVCVCVIIQYCLYRCMSQ